MKHPRTRCRKVMSVLSSKGKDISKGFSVCAHFPKCLIMVLDYEQPLEACESAPLIHCKELWCAWLNSTFFAPGLWEHARRWQKKASLYWCITSSKQTSLVWSVLFIRCKAPHETTHNLTQSHVARYRFSTSGSCCQSSSIHATPRHLQEGKVIVMYDNVISYTVGK